MVSLIARMPSSLSISIASRCGEWFVVTTVVDDPTYLARSFVTSSHFRREPDDQVVSEAVPRVVQPTQAFATPPEALAEARKALS